MSYLELANVKRRAYGFNDRLNQWKIREKAAVESVEIAFCDYKKSNVPPEAAAFKPYQQGTIWSKGVEEHCWFKVRFAIPESFKDGDIYFVIKPEQGCACVQSQYTAIVDGTAVQGMDNNHAELRLKGGESEVLLYAYSGSLGAGRVSFDCELQLWDRETWGLYYDINLLRNILNFGSEESALVYQAKKALNGAIDLVDTLNPGDENYAASVLRARDYLKREFFAKQTPLDVTVANIGHTHIDVAWLWPMRQTREKAQRSFSTVISLMEQYPQYKFMSSQPALYYFVQQDDPELFKKIQARVKEGRWDVEGGTWLEMDCNLTGGESFCRQLLFGQRYFQENFGRRTRSLWLPDVFGYSAALPQLLTQAGIDTFVTAKITWNETNCLPYDLFWWQGLDGTRILSCFITSHESKKDRKTDQFTTYTGDTLPSWQDGTYRRFNPKDNCDLVINTYGYGDGGGGSTMAMIEYCDRQRQGLTGLPRAEFMTASEALEGIHAMARKGEVPDWRGELYLEFHRGTYTSVAGVKRGNRRAEFNFLTTEGLSSLAKLAWGREYPKQKFEDLWRMVLTNQFHDILPGSSIQSVYDVTLKELADCEETLLALKGELLKDLAGRVAASQAGLLVYNPHGCAESGLVDVEGGKAFVADIPAHGYKVVPASQVVTSCKVKAAPNCLENDLVKITFADNGTISSYVDKVNGRELVEAGKAFNRLVIYEDIPETYDNWELKSYHTRKGWPLVWPTSVEVVEEGARKGVKSTFSFGKSSLVQTVFLSDGSPRADFVTEVDWQETDKVLKAEFATSLFCDYATYDVQFGSVRRPTTRNTSWEAAKFEVCAHKYMDLSEPDCGLSLMNDCKYGHSCDGGLMAITLLKSSSDPTPDCSKGFNRFTYALMAHEGAFDQAAVLASALELNEPLAAIPVARQQGALPESFSLVSSTSPAVTVETVKESEDRQGYVLRAMEVRGSHASAVLELGRVPKSARLVNLLEDEGEELEIRDGGIALSFHPFEVKSIKLVF